MNCDYVKDYEFVAIFDADFRPDPDFLKRTVPHFKDNDELALVQGRWSFVNRDENLLTRLQYINLSFHFEVEQQVNSVFVNFFGFNGTTGVWRIKALEESGGWLERTTVEDMDIAVRAHLNGWKFIFPDDVKGLILVTLSASLRSLHQSWIFFFSIYLVALGQGGHKPCLQAFGADQFEDGNPVEKKYKSSFFNYWYWGIFFGTLLGVTVLLYIQDNVGWGLGFGIPAVTMLIALFAFLCGTRFYGHKLPDGSPLTRIVHVFVATFHKWNVSSPRQEGKKVAAAAESEGLKLGSRRQCLPTDQFKLSLLADHD